MWKTFFGKTRFYGIFSKSRFFGGKARVIRPFPVNNPVEKVEKPYFYPLFYNPYFPTFQRAFIFRAFPVFSV